MVRICDFLQDMNDFTVYMKTIQFVLQKNDNGLRPFRVRNREPKTIDLSVVFGFLFSVERFEKWYSLDNRIIKMYCHSRLKCRFL